MKLARWYGSNMWYNFLFCPISVLSVSFFGKFEISEEKSQDFTEKGVLYHPKALHSTKRDIIVSFIR